MQPLPTKLILSKKRAKEGKSSDEVEHFPVPSRAAVRPRETVSAVELKESEVCCRNIIGLLKLLVLFDFLHSCFLIAHLLVMFAELPGFKNLKRKDRR
ncbi:hypothetical protein RHMOL_Rhmol08G0322900 [Rhododendron molle]|uniref:Uncharacterized protein n=1 Tax=Rhododendron molle TaxID=49168 RepID=A0ACC0MV54_RHOML|nr:hypothetical protein RHMOL_Rhmol08G0322900 [Rhododendron molle]